MWWKDLSVYATNTSVDVVHAGGTDSFTVDQTTDEVDMSVIDQNGHRTG